MTTTTLKGYARHRGCTPAAVRRAINSQRLRHSIRRGDRGHWVIEVELADQEWDANTDPRQRRERHRTAATRQVDGLFGKVSAPAPARNGAAAEDQVDLQAARYRREQLTAELQELELQQKRGQLVPREQLEKVGSWFGVLVQEAVLAVPHDQAAVLAAATDPAEVQALLDAALRRALEEASERVQAVASRESGR